MRVAVVCLILAAVCVVVGTALFSPRSAVLVAGGCFLVGAALQVDVSTFTERRTK